MDDARKRKRCGAKTRSGYPCKRGCAPGRTRCKFHGGASPAAGPDHPRWKHGRYSRAIPRDIVEKVRDAREDPTLQGLREEIAALQVLLEDEWQRVWALKSDGAFQSLGDLLKRTNDVLLDWDAEKAESILRDFAGAMDHANAVSRGVDRVRLMMLSKGRLLAEEGRHLERAQQVITMERAYGLLKTFLDIVVDEVRDTDRRLRIERRMAEHFGLASISDVDSE